jgi:N-acetylglucosamine kinase-like BadF-type ATPase
MARYVVGFDCGGTSTRGVLVDGKREVLAHAAAGPGNPLSAGMAVAARSYAAVFRRLLEDAGLEPRQIGAVGLGAAGAGRPAEQRRIRAVLRALAPAARIRIDSDGLIALLGATQGRGGIIVIAGTGSFVLGVDRRRRQARGGGWGPLLGDEGSGATIGRAAIQAVLRAEDGREPPTKLRRVVFGHFGVRSCADLVTRIYAKPPTPRQSAELWPGVLRAAGSGDSTARTLLEQGGAELAATVEAVAARLDFGAVDFPLILSGGVLQNDSPLRSTLLRRLRRSVPRARLAESAAPPEMGAVFLVSGVTKA